MSAVRRVWAARLLIGAVLLINVQCALAFLFWPSAYAPSFELAGAPGAAAVRGTGLLFLMWNVPYAFALSDPLRRRVSLVEALIMQALGVVGESMIAALLPPEQQVLRGSLLRFILFDGAGLLALLAAFWITRKQAAPNPAR